MARRKITQDARDLYGDAIAQQGDQWGPLGQRIRDGFENLWITPALRAIDRALDEGRYDPDPR